jgi:hypothetical protein
MCLYLLFFNGHPDSYRDCSLLIIPVGDKILNMLGSYVTFVTFALKPY